MRKEAPCWSEQRKGLGSFQAEMANLAAMWRRLKIDGKEAKPEAGRPAGYSHNPREVAVAGSHRAGKKWSDSGDILKVELTVFADGENMGHERKQGGRDDVKSF